MRVRMTLLMVAAAVMTVAALHATPRGIEASRVLAAKDDPNVLAERAVAARLSAGVAEHEIRAALASDDIDLAQSFLDLARERDLPLDPALVAAVARESEPSAVATRAAGSFASGLITGEPDDLYGLAGTALGDLFVFGDVRDILREGYRYVTGAHVDNIVFGLAGAGLAVTAGTYASLGAGVPFRAGVSTLKAARKTDRLSAPLAASVGRLMREPKASSTVAFIADVGRIERKAGLRTALDGMAIARNPADVAKVAKLAEKQGGKTRAILKLAGRGAIALGAAAFDLAMWLLWAAWSLIGFCAAMKRLAERSTERALAGRRRRLAAMRERVLANP